MKVTCTRCIAPVPVDGDRVGKHREQIVGARGWVDGYQHCEAAGQKLNQAQLRELLPPDPEAPLPTGFPVDFAEVARVIGDLPGYIKEARLSQGISLRRLASDIGLTYKTIDRIERGEGMYTESLLTVLRWLDGYNLTARGQSEEHVLRETARILRGAA